MTKIWHISDTHGHHGMLDVPYDIDVVVFSGDESNFKDFKNTNETLDFLEWFGSLYIETKIMIAGNHSAAIYNKWIVREEIQEKGIIYLENETVIVGGIKYFGTPYTPTFNEWFFMKDRAKMYKIWDLVEPDTDVIISHGPPKGVLDLSLNPDGSLDMCGDSNLRSRILKRDLNPKAVLFGHIHNTDIIINQGVLKLSGYDTVFSNGSVVEDGKFGKITANGNIIELC
jgi:Icc-related predicted phosphoesterase